jgi:2-methylcitrate dehydratase PrpD
MSGPPPGPTATLAAFAADLDPASLPPATLHAAKRLVIDWLGCRAGGRRAAAGRLALAWANGAAAPSVPGSASGGSPRTADSRPLARPDAPLLAAYADGRLAAVLDADETYPSARQASHLAAASVAAALAIGAAEHRSGAEFLAAVVAGYEVGGRISDAMMPAPGAGSTGLRAGWGPGSVLGATAAGGRAQGLDAGQLAHALGIAATHVGPPPLAWTSVRPAPMAKSADAGWHALAAVAAVQQARLGLTGYDAILDGPDGLWRALGYGGSDDDALVDGLGSSWRIDEAAFKRWPVQYWMQPAITALAEVLGAGPVDPAAIESIVLAVNDKCRSAKFVDPEPPGEVDRAFSLPHAAAMLVLGIPAGPAWSDDAVADREDVRRLRRLVRVERHPEAGSIDSWVVDHRYRELPASATVIVAGATATAEVRAGLGSPWSDATRLSDADLIAKARALAGWPDPAGPAVAALDRSVDWILTAEAQPDTHELVRRLDPDPTTEVT